MKRTLNRELIPGATRLSMPGYLPKENNFYVNKRRRKRQTQNIINYGVYEKETRYIFYLLCEEHSIKPKNLLGTRNQK